MEREPADDDVVAFASFFFRQPDAGHLRRGIDAGRHRLVAHVPARPQGVAHGTLALGRCQVGPALFRPSRHHGVDLGDVGLQAVIDCQDYSAEPDRCVPFQTGRNRLATDSENHFLGCNGLTLAGDGPSRSLPSFHTLDPFNLGLSDDPGTAFPDTALQRAGDFRGGTRDECCEAQGSWSAPRDRWRSQPIRPR